MQQTTRRRLVFHGAIVLTLGMLCGAGLAAALLGYIDSNPDDWKLGHMEGLTNGLLVLLMAACGGLLTLSPKAEKLLYWNILVTGYGNAVYGWVRAISGETGLDFSPPFANQLAALLGGVPVVTAFVAVAVVIWAARGITSQDAGSNG